MGELFNVNNKFFSGMNKMVDSIFVTMLWIIGCIPIVTIGASTTALYYTVHKSIYHSQGYVFSEFRHAFKTNFKQSTIVWLILFAVGAFLGTDAYLTYQLKNAGDKVGNIFYFIILFLIIEFIITIYIFPYISRFSDDIKTTFKNAAFMAFGNPFKTLMMILTSLAVVYMVYVLPLLIVVAPTLYMLGIEQFMEKIYTKFVPQEKVQERHNSFNGHRKIYR